MLIYESYLKKFIDKKPRFLEIGIQYGGGLRMWEEYFINAKIFGIDINCILVYNIIDLSVKVVWMI